MIVVEPECSPGLDALYLRAALFRAVFTWSELPIGSGR
jgi:hypothetical protein